MLKRIAVLLSGGGTDFQSILDAIDEKKINGEVVLVVSNREKAYGLERARQKGIQTEVVKKNDAEILRLCRNAKVDFIVLAGYLSIVGGELIFAYKDKIINIHPSLIPSFSGPGYYGMHVHEEVYRRGVKVSGATIHFVSSEVDGGPIIYQEAVDISNLNSPSDIQKRVLEIEHRILPYVVGKMCEDKVVIENGKARII